MLLNDISFFNNKFLIYRYKCDLKYKKYNECK